MEIFFFTVGISFLLGEDDFFFLVSSAERWFGIFSKLELKDKYIVFPHVNKNIAAVWEVGMGSCFALLS